MPKRKQVDTGSAPAGTTFSLMDSKIDVLEGLVMHKKVISEQFENELIEFVQMQCESGRRGELKKPIYIRPSGARSQGNKREAIMYGGFFDFNRARPGKRGLVPPFPPILDRLVDHLISNNYLPEEVRPDSCIINQYDVGDCIPPHVDHSSYYRPISTLSLLGEEPMLMGSRFRTVRPCTWAPTCGTSIPLARRSLLVLGGNSGDIAKHCISACKGPRISITLRKQPPPDWKPDESELVGKGGKRSQRGDDRGGVSGKMKEGKDVRPKGKSLSGSAKRRKKMTKKSGTEPEKSSETTNQNSNSSERVGTSKHNPEKGPGKPKVATKASEQQKSEKQARRNARRLEKKKADAASGDTK
mmetsp:Transcript_492/g.984  ORF Transcript_492/g.984 Transcript_492/m.984 type:complete len:357 (+) Transcript_492:245-1315(+)|eukprot:CAMPEP_0172301818 /NCGR_PEP_ID=MMETSP1058-20130122/3638_1 /TAXON_ID=83371 /ORGANISM="Detonula confervacea, Strain CCMP 353" /LENGTH=356 /DNA_ID=CAMNT_0013012087 /DNA_START=198 /DNA_END=1268 /DNA_ORIENTATION=+